ncbi:hypothetical protein [Komagataeibacter nataicola]|uniref:hypothetical protein n=1 Tax=Komagataeibacter nataicola TaxID=265960 RepID=UPI0011B8431E|nr:hypothetical protein [Komagataeibacter nataicola]WNM09211.1 hypothetical protein RI056_04175 [Komagataeibacter nataicola]GBR21868.1 hypothetical protein AA0616_2133 [Komagataeibacter nataicola NRIC 0616]
MIEAYLKKRGEITNTVFIENCGVPAEQISKLIHSFSHALIRRDDYGAWSFPGSSLFIGYNGRKIALSTIHQLKQKMDVPRNLENVMFSTTMDNQHVVPNSIFSDESAPEEGLDIALYELPSFATDGKVLCSTQFYPLLEDRLWPAGAIDDFMFVCGFPEYVDKQYGPSPTLDYPEWDDKISDITEANFCTSNVLMSALKITNQTRQGFFSAQLLVDGHICVNGLSGSPIFYIGKNKEGLFLGLAGIVVRGSCGSKVLNFAPASYVYSIINSYISLNTDTTDDKTPS